MIYKKVTQESYEATAEEFAQHVAELAPLPSIEKFIQMLPPKAKIIDIGSGSGRDAKIFTEKGIAVVGIDFSQNFIDIAKAHAPLAEFKMMDIESISFSPASFDGAWAACSLLHFPKKVLPSILKNIHTLLKEKGHLYLALKKGVGEALQKDSRYGDFEKFWSYYEEDELREIVESANFKVLELATVEKQHAYQTHDAIRIYAQKV
jgi:SAM-dependent methyltransferase